MSALLPAPPPPSLARLSSSRWLRTANTARTLWRARRNLLHMFHPDVADLPWHVARLGPARLITVADAGLARHVLGDDLRYRKGPLYRALLGDVLGEGSLLLEGEAARRRRRLIAPAFAPPAMARVERIVARRVAATVDGWAAGGVADLTTDCARLAMGVALEAFFGADLGRRAAQVAETLDRLLMDASTPSLADLLGLGPWAPRRSRRAVRRMVAEIDAELYALIDARGGGAGEGDLLDRLLAARDAETGEGLSRKVVRDEVMTLFMAGHETTALSLAWGLDRLAREPEWSARLAADPAAVPRAYEEVLRLYPPAYAVAREAMVADRYDGPAGRLEILPGDRIQIPVFMIHRGPAWERPEAFDPDRFLGPANPAFLPFGAGPRACVGMALARLEGRALLTEALTRLSIAPAGPPPRALGRVTLRTEAPIRLRVSPRTAP